MTTCGPAKPVVSRRAVLALGAAIGGVMQAGHAAAPAQTGEFLCAEVERWGFVIRSANVTVE